MSTIARATIKSYDATTHSATVQIAGSLAVWLDAVPVSDGIAPADVVAGRECGVIFFTDDNPADAAVVTIHNAVPVGWPGTATAGSKIIDADADSYVNVEQSADEDMVRMVVGGTLRYLLQGVTPHHTLTGDLMLTGAGYIYPVVGGASPSVPNAQCGLLIGDSADDYNAMMGLGVFVGTGFALSANNLTGVGGKAIAVSNTTTTVNGLDFQAGHLLATGNKTLNVMRGGAFIGGGAGAGTITVKGLTLSAIAGLSGTYAAINYTGLEVVGTNNAKLTKWTGLSTASSFNAATVVVPLEIGGAARTTDTDGSYHRMNLQLFGPRAFGTGDGVLGIGNATTNPSTNPAVGVVVYVDAADGKLKCRGSAGTVTVLAVP